MKKYIQVIILMCGVLGGNLSKAQSVIVSIDDEGDWSDPSTWVGGIVPGEDDDVIISNDALIFVDVSEVVVKSLKIGSTSSNKEASLEVLEGNRLIVKGNCDIYSGGYRGTSTVRAKQIVVLSNSTLEVYGELIIHALENDLGGVRLLSSANLYLKGGIELPNQKGYLIANSTASVVLNGSSPQQIYIGHGTGIEYPNLIIDGDSVFVVGETEGYGGVKGSLLINKGTFNNTGRQINVIRDITIEDEAGFHLIGGSTITVSTGTSLTIKGKLVTQHIDGLRGFQYPGSINLGANAEIEFAGSNPNQTTGFVSFTTTPTFRKLVFSNTAGTTLNRSINVDNIVVSSGGVLNGGENGTPYDIFVTSSWTNNGIFNGQTGTVRLAGTTSALLGEGVNNFNNLIIDSGVDFTAPQTLSVSGDLIVNPGGNFNHNNGRVVFHGPSSRTSGVGTFYDVTATGVVFQGQDTIIHELSLLGPTTSTVESSASLVLDLDKGFIDPASTTSISGITFIKQVHRSGPSYLSFPVSTTVGELKALGFESVHNHSESRPKAYVEMTDDATVIPVDGKGYVAVLDDADATLRLTGNYTPSDVSVTLTSTHTANGEIRSGRTSWNLLGNPYPFELDWDLLRADYPSIHESFYISTGSQFFPYVSGVPANGGKIPAMQTVMVYLRRYTSGANREVTIPLARAAGLKEAPGALYRKAPIYNVLKLEVSNGNEADATYVRFSDDATTEFESALDASKLKNTGNVPSFYSYLSGTNYAINSVPATFSNFSLPIAFEPKVAGEYTITLSEEYTYDLPYEIVLEDKVLNTFHPIDSDREYTFATNKNEPHTRFVLHFNNPVITAMQESAYNFVRVFSSGADITIQGIQVEELSDVVVYDVAGQLIASYSEVDLKGKQFVISSLGRTGMFIVNVRSGDKNHSERVILN